MKRSRETVAAKRKQTETMDLFTGKPVVAKALAFATAAHQGQTRKYTGEPYVSHPIEVAKILVQHGLTSQRHLIVALLHDTMEDCGVSHRDLCEAFGTMMADDVEALTVHKSAGNRARRCELKISRVVGRGILATQVKIADIISNIQDVALHDPAFAQTYLAEKKVALDAFRNSKFEGPSFRGLLNTALDAYSEGLNQCALSVLADENDRVAKDADTRLEIEAILYRQQTDELAEYAMF